MSMPEELALFYTIEALRLVEGMHKLGFVHGNICPATLLTRNDPWLELYS